MLAMFCHVNSASVGSDDADIASSRGREAMTSVAQDQAMFARPYTSKRRISVIEEDASAANNGMCVLLMAANAQAIFAMDRTLKSEIRGRAEEARASSKGSSEKFRVEKAQAVLVSCCAL